MPARNLSKHRFGCFVIGLFAGVCAAIFPRLATLIGAPTNISGAIEIDAFRPPYVVASIVFASIIGIAVMIWEWNAKSSPRQTFVAALGLPALIAGALNSVAISSNAWKLGQDLKQVSDQYRSDNAITIEEPVASSTPDKGSLLWNLYPVGTVFAQDKASEVRVSVLQQRGTIDLGVYRQRKFWVVLERASTKEEADKRSKELGLKYGALTIQRFENKYAITLQTILPYSEAVSKAVAVKRESKSVISPTLVPIQ